MDNSIWDIKDKEKVCCFDIDGVLMSCYPDCWVNFVNKELDTEHENLNFVKASVPYDIYRTLKEKYRLSGIKESFPADKDAAELTKALKQKGYVIIIVTARPVQKYPCLYQQTMNWLNKNNITYDLVYFGEKNKHVKILTDIHNLKFMVEDNSYIANQVARWGYRVFLLDNIYNRGLTLEPNVIKVYSLKDIMRYL